MPAWIGRRRRCLQRRSTFPCGLHAGGTASHDRDNENRSRHLLLVLFIALLIALRLDETFITIDAKLMRRLWRFIIGKGFVAQSSNQRLLLTNALGRVDFGQAIFSSDLGVLEQDSTLENLEAR